MIYKIAKGKHRARPLRLGLFRIKRPVSALVIFHEDCRYKLTGEDQRDTNKLFGVGYLCGLGKDSARFGWRYDETIDKIVLSAYLHTNGPFEVHELESVNFLDPVLLSITIYPGYYQFKINDRTVGTFIYSHRKTWVYPMGLYFGGNQPAPHEMTVDIKRL